MVESTLKDGTVIHEIMHWQEVSDDGSKLVKWAIYGDPLAYKKVAEGKPIKVCDYY